MFVFRETSLLRGRTTASLKICLRGQVFVRAGTSRSHLMRSTDDRNLTMFFGYQNKLGLSRNQDLSFVVSEKLFTDSEKSI